MASGDEASVGRDEPREGQELPATALRAPSAGRVRRDWGLLGVRGLAYVLGGGAVGLCAYFVWLFASIAARRVAYPFDLEWMEGSIVEHVARLLEGKPLYAKPTVDFVAYIYNPLYYYAAIPFTWVLGLNLLALRSLSLAAASGTFVLLFAFVRRETGSYLAAALSVGVLAATFPLSGQWMDLARVDTLFLFLMLASAWFARFAETRRGLACGAAFAFLAFATKQTAVPIALALAIAVFVRVGLGRSLWYALPAAILSGGWTGYMVLTTQGWYWYYAFLLPASHGTATREMLIVDYWKVEIFGALPIAFAAQIALLFNFTSRSRRSGAVFHVLFGSSLLFAGYFARIHTGSYLNDLMPAHLALAMAVGVTSGEVIRRLDSEGAFAGYRGRMVCSALAIVQLLPLVYEPRFALPTEADRAAGERLIRRLEAMPGEMLLMHRPYLGRMAGKRSYATMMAVVDLFKADHDIWDARRDLIREFEAALAAKRWEYVVLDLDRDFHFMGALEKNYQRVYAPPLFDERGTFYEVTGGRGRPEFVYRKNGD